MLVGHSWYSFGAWPGLSRHIGLGGALLPLPTHLVCTLLAVAVVVVDVDGVLQVSIVSGDVRHHVAHQVEHALPARPGLASKGLGSISNPTEMNAQSQPSSVRQCGLAR